MCFANECYTLSSTYIYNVFDWSLQYNTLNDWQCHWVIPFSKFAPHLISASAQLSKKIKSSWECTDILEICIIVLPIYESYNLMISMDMHLMQYLHPACNLCCKCNSYTYPSLIIMEEFDDKSLGKGKFCMTASFIANNYPQRCEE